MSKRSGIEIDPAQIRDMRKRIAERRGGMEPIPEKIEPCRHPEHQPPSHICIPNGMQYRHVCPACGIEQVIRPMRVWL